MLVLLFAVSGALCTVPLPAEDPAGPMRTAKAAASDSSLQKWAMKKVCSTATCHPKTKRVEEHVRHQLARWIRAGYDRHQIRKWTVRYAEHLATPPAPGPALPFQEAKKADGGTWIRAAKPTVLTFGSSWATPFTKRDLPVLRRLASANRDVDFVTVADSDDVAKLQSLLSQPLILVVDPSSRMRVAVGVEGVPEHLFIDAEGYIIEHQLGTLDVSRFVQWLAETNE